MENTPSTPRPRAREDKAMENTRFPARPWRTPLPAAATNPWNTPGSAAPMENTYEPRPGRHQPPPDFGPTLTAARNRAGLGLRAAARAAGISPGYLCLLEQGRRSPSETTAEALIDALNATGQDAQSIRDAAIPGTGRDYAPPLPAHYGTPITRRRWLS